MLFSAKTIDCIINIIMWLFMQLVLAKGVINNNTGGVSTGLSSISAVFGVGSSTDGGWQQESGAYMMYLVTSCQLQHIVHSLARGDFGEIYAACPDCFQDTFYNKILTSKIFGKPFGVPSLCPVYSILILRYLWQEQLEVNKIIVIINNPKQ